MGHPHNRAERRHHRQRVLKNRLKVWRINEESIWGRQEDGAPRLPNHAIGLWAKRKPYDCGHTRCPICHPHKTNKIDKKRRRRLMYHLPVIKASETKYRHRHDFDWDQQVYSYNQDR